MRKTRPAAWMLLPGLLFLGFIVWTQRDRVLTGRNDFIQLWVGANLVGTPGLYDVAANNDLQIRTIGVLLDGVSPHSRPPFYAFLLKPLGRLPYPVAYAIFEALSLACLGAFIWRNIARMPELGLYCSLSVPIMANLVQGQDLALVLFFLTVSLALFENRRDLPAGAVLTLCAIKFHLFLLVPFVLILHRRWRGLAGGAIGAAILTALCFLAQGPHWIAQYMGALRNPNITGWKRTPTIHGALTILGWGSPGVEIPLAIGIAALTLYLAWREPDFEVAFGYALIGGLLISYHAFLQDCVVLLPAVVAILSKVEAPAVRHLTVIAALPPVYLLLLAGENYALPLPFLLIAILAAAAYPTRSRDRAAARIPGSSHRFAT